MHETNTWKKNIIRDAWDWKMYGTSDFYTIKTMYETNTWKKKLQTKHTYTDSWLSSLIAKNQSQTLVWWPRRMYTDFLSTFNFNNFFEQQQK